MAALTNRELRDRMNSIPEHQLEHPVGVIWTDSDQTGEAKDVEIDEQGRVDIVV